MTRWSTADRRRALRNGLAQAHSEGLDRLRSRMRAGAPVWMRGHLVAPCGRYGGPFVEMLRYAERHEVLKCPMGIVQDVSFAYQWTVRLAEGGLRDLEWRLLRHRVIHTNPYVPTLDGTGELCFIDALQESTYDELLSVVEQICRPAPWRRRPGWRTLYVAAFEKGAGRALAG